MKQELTIPEQESKIDIKIGDMFRWTEKAENNNEFIRFIYLGDIAGGIEIPFNSMINSGGGIYSFLSDKAIKKFIKNGQVERLPKGTTFTITQE